MITAFFFSARTRVPSQLIAGQVPGDTGVSLDDVPYLPQTEALCGGAAAAMLFRYWGDRHASVQQFAPLVDRKAGGIADDALTKALRDRRWSAVRLAGSVATLRSELAAGRPPILLLEDRPLRYHYVVVVGIDEQGVSIHDPTWGPSRHLPSKGCWLRGNHRASGHCESHQAMRVPPGCRPPRAASDHAATRASATAPPRGRCVTSDSTGRWTISSCKGLRRGGGPDGRG